MSQKQTPAIVIDQLSFSYHHEQVLRDISLTIEQGDFIGLIGQNGSGKSTLLKLILGLLPLQKGTISLFGQSLPTFSAWGQIGYVAQHSLIAQQQPISVKEVLRMTGATTEAIQEALALVNLLDQQQRVLTDLSGGQQQRVFIARALLKQPRLLILDEPTVGVDSRSQQQFYALLKHLNQSKKLTIILVSHELDVVAKIVDKVACLNQTLIYHGAASAILEQELLEQLYGKQHRLIAHHH